MLPMLAIGGLSSFSVEGQGSKALLRSSWRAIIDADGPCLQ